MLSALGSLGRTKRQTGEQSSWQALTGGLWGGGEEGGLSAVYRKRGNPVSMHQLHVHLLQIHH